MLINSMSINNTPIDSALNNNMPTNGARMKREETAVLYVAVSFPPSFC